jgi:hypothetical protein
VRRGSLVLIHSSTVSHVAAGSRPVVGWTTGVHTDPEACQVPSRAPEHSLLICQGTNEGNG